MEQHVEEIDSNLIAANGSEINSDQKMTNSTNSSEDKHQSKEWLWLALCGLPVIIYLGCLQLQLRVDIPEHLLGTEARFFPNLLSENVGNDLIDLMKQMGTFPTNAADVQFYKTLHEHIGEAEPLNTAGSCDNPYLIPSIDRTLCILPGRIDVARHFMLYGGLAGLKERYEDATSRLQSFGRYMFNLTEFPIVKTLFESKQFITAAKSVCPRKKQFLDPFQFNFIIQVPGQTVALHIDAPYFWGATRFQYPQWLLAVMVFSNLFRDKFIDQVQVVGYLHRWNDTKRERGGEFVYWNERSLQPKWESPVPLSGSIVDGSKTVHAATVYYPDRKAPFLDKARENLLKYDSKTGKWKLTSDGILLKTYSTDDLRVTIVYRAKCFASEAERDRFHEESDDETKHIPLETIFSTLKKDLVARRRLTSVDQSISQLDLALLLLHEYVSYPLPPSAVIPWNYCMLIKLYPWTNALLKFVC